MPPLEWLSQIGKWVSIILSSSYWIKRNFLSNMQAYVENVGATPALSTLQHFALLSLLLATPIAQHAVQFPCLGGFVMTTFETILHP